MLCQALRRASSGALQAPTQRLVCNQLGSLHHLLTWQQAGPSSACATCEPSAATAASGWARRPFSSAPAEDEEDDVSVRCSERVRQIADSVCELTLLEISDLTELLAKKLGVPMGMGMGMPMMGMGMPGPGAMPAAAAPAAEAAAPVEEQTEFDVKLDGYDAAAKIKVIKEVRAITGLGLKESKELVEGAPTVVKKALKKEEAEALKAQLEAAGAKVVLE